MQQAIAPGTVIDKRYQIQKKIPDTTSNQCYLAEDTDQSNRLVVISFPRMELLTLPGFTAAFDDACQRLMKARLNGLVKILDHGEYDSQPYSVLQYVTDETLANSLAAGKNSHKKVSVDEVLDWARPLAVTLDELHELDYVHSNVRPTQIYLGQKRQVLLGDFVTEFTIQRLGAFKQAIASLDIADHLAPEYIKSNYNESYDQYLLATIVYEALAGRTHFHNPGSTEAYRRQVATKFPEPLLTHRPELVGASRILGKALERNPVKRFDNCREFVNQLGTAQVNPVFANNEDKPVTVIKKVIDETIPDADPIITSIRSNHGSGRKKGLVWLGLLLVGLGAGAYAVNHFGGIEQFKTKLTTAWSDFSKDSAAETDNTQVIVPISGNIPGTEGSQSSPDSNSASNGSEASEASNPTSLETGQSINTSEQDTDEQEKVEQTGVNQQNNDTAASTSSETIVKPDVSSEAASKPSAVAITSADPNAVIRPQVTAEPAGVSVATQQAESDDEQVVVDDVIKSATADSGVAELAGSEINDTDLLAAINLSLAEGEAEFRKKQSKTNQAVENSVTKARSPEAVINEAISLALQEAQADFMRQTSPAGSDAQDGAVNDAGAEAFETINPDSETTEQAIDATQQLVETVTEPPEMTDQIGVNTEENAPLTTSEVETDRLNTQMLEAARLADEQAAASRLAAQEKKRQQEARRQAREEAKKKADEEAKQKAEAEAEKKAEEDARRNAAAEAARNEARQNEVVSAPVVKSFDDMQQERARIQALKAQKTARRNSITYDCVTSGKIHRQVIAGNLPYVKNCLSVGVDPNITQSNRWTLLHLASIGGYLNMTKLLLAKGADINAKSVDGKTPLDMATEQKQSRMVTYLRSRGGVTTR